MRPYIIIAFLTQRLLRYIVFVLFLRAIECLRITRYNNSIQKYKTILFYLIQPTFTDFEYNNQGTWDKAFYNILCIAIVAVWPYFQENVFILACNVEFRNILMLNKKNIVDLLLILLMFACYLQ